MARSNDPDSASSQFFICHQDATHCDGQYAAFGRVTSGMDIVDKICTKTYASQETTGTNPTYNIVDRSEQPVISKMTVTLQ